MQKRIFILAAVVIVGAIGIWGYQIYASRHPSTEDAYISANVVRVAPRVSGQVASLAVSNHQTVKQGQLLFRIDTTPYEFAVQQAQAQLALARRQVAQAQAAVASAQAEVHNRQVLLDNARDKLRRAKKLVKKDYISAERVTDAEANYKSASANLEVAQARLDEARRQLGKPGDNNDRIVEAQAVLDKAKWQLNNTKVTAACTGKISELNLQPGNIVSADREAFVLVCNNQYWVDANFKETQVERIQPGQAVKVSVDMYPDHSFQGIVEDISAATGSVFSLLPPQNASGNWVKVIQRVPIKIRIVHPDPKYPLLVGSSTTVTINTNSSAKKPQATASNNSLPQEASVASH